MTDCILNTEAQRLYFSVFEVSAKPVKSMLMNFKTERRHPAGILRATKMVAFQKESRRFGRLI
jgi:hypothetical protein